MSESMIRDESENAQKFINLDIGEVKILKAGNEKVFTVLGSCVSVIFHVPKLMSMICHAQMPLKTKIDANGADRSAPNFFKNEIDPSDFVYANTSIEHMINILLKNNVNLRKIHTTILGGASMFMCLDNKNSIGSQNIAVAKNILAKYNIRINREMTGGINGLTVWYYASNNKLILNRHTENRKFELADIKLSSLIV